MVGARADGNAYGGPMVGAHTTPGTAPAAHDARETQEGPCRSYAGVDLAADPKRTGLAVVRAEPTRLVVESVRVGATDDDVIHAVHHSDGAGIDVPFGWPDPFVSFICAHAAGRATAPPDTDPQWRRGMAQRTTDRHVHARTGLTPLSVSTDRIAYPALRWAALEGRLRNDGLPVPRDGSGRTSEVYPAAALARWGLPHRGYKAAKNAAGRRTLLARLGLLLPWLSWEGHETTCQADDNALDAVLAALVAREIDLGRCEAAPPELSAVVAREGWVWIPASTPTPPAAYC